VACDTRHWGWSRRARALVWTAWKFGVRHRRPQKLQSLCRSNACISIATEIWPSTRCSVHMVNPTKIKCLQGLERHMERDGCMDEFYQELTRTHLPSHSTARRLLPTFACIPCPWCSLISFMLITLPKLIRRWCQEKARTRISRPAGNTGRCTPKSALLERYAACTAVAL
jgi:hypothetical protein